MMEVFTCYPDVLGSLGRAFISNVENIIILQNLSDMVMEVCDYGEKKQLPAHGNI